MVDFLTFVVSREDVMAGSTDVILDNLKTLIESPEQAAKMKESVEISFAGFDNDPRELFEIEEVRKFVFELDDKFPFWLFFLTKFGLGLQCVFFCQMPPYLTDEAKAEIFPQRLANLLEKRWLPAMNHIAEFAGESEDEILRLAERSISYFVDGPFKTSRER